jgi:predicted RNA-binding protein associated with RNAse of E/G family
MDWMNVLEQVFELVVYPVLSLAGVYLTYYIGVKIQEIKQKTNDETARKYLDMLDITIQNAVLATTQTYVDSLKKQGKFDAEAQKEAFRLTYDAVMKVITADAVKYITSAIGDLEIYITNKIEADVKLSKSI